MDSGFPSFTFGFKGLKREASTQEDGKTLNSSLSKHSKRLGFSAASNLTNSYHSDPGEDHSLKEYKANESLLNNHWLFSDTSPEKPPFSRPFVTHPNTNAIATARVPSIQQPSGFRFASGKQCSTLNTARTEHFRKLLGLDDLESDANVFKTPTYRPYSSRPLSFSPSRHNSPNVYHGVRAEAKPADQTASQPPFAATTNLSDVDVWNEVCTFTGYHTSKMSLDVVSRLWRENGNPLSVSLANVERYRYLLYTHENDFVTVGGIKEVMACFKRLAANLNIRRDEFDDSWLRDKFMVLTLKSCRRYSKKIVNLYKKGTLEEAVMNVPLPNPIKLLRQLVKLAKNELPASDSIVFKIFQGDSSPDVPVVLRVEGRDGNLVYLSDGIEIFKGAISDNHLRNLFESGAIGTRCKLLVQGITYKEEKGEHILVLNFNSVSMARRRLVGLQPRHTNANIRDLAVGGGRVPRVEVIVLRNFPLVYKILYKCPETPERRALFLSENEYSEITNNHESPIIGAIESVSIQFTMFVVDAGLLKREFSDEELDRALGRSCVHITLLNVEDTAAYILKPLTRLVLTNTFISYTGGHNFLHEGPSGLNPVKLSCTQYSKLDILESNSAIPDSLKTTEASQVVFSNLPALSLPEDCNDTSLFYDLHFKNDRASLFLGQICDVNGVILHVGEIEGPEKHSFLRIFLLTTRLYLVSVKVTYKNSMDQNDRISIRSEIVSLQNRLKSIAIALDSGGKTPSDLATNLFFLLCNLQYVGFDEDHNIYNFQVSCEQLILKPSKALKALQDMLVSRELVYKRTNIRLSSPWFHSLGSEDSEKTCKIFLKVLKNNLYDVHRLVSLHTPQTSQLSEPQALDL